MNIDCTLFFPSTLHLTIFCFFFFFFFYLPWIACVFDTSGSLDEERTGRTVHAKKSQTHPSVATHTAKSGVKYYARVFVARGGNDGMLRLPLNKRLEVHIGDGYYRAADPPTSQSRMLCLV